MMRPDLRKEAWSPEGISPGEVSCLRKYCTPINLDPKMGERQGREGTLGEAGNWEGR